MGDYYEEMVMTAANFAKKCNDLREYEEFILDFVRSSLSGFIEMLSRREITTEIVLKWRYAKSIDFTRTRPEMKNNYECFIDIKLDMLRGVVFSHAVSEIKMYESPRFKKLQIYDFLSDTITKIGRILLESGGS